MNNQDKKELNTYQRLSKEAQQRNAERATAYNRDKAVKITIKTKAANFTDIDQYMNKAIKSEKSKSKNDFLLSAVRYAIEKDFKGVN